MSSGIALLVRAENNREIDENHSHIQQNELAKRWVGKNRNCASGEVKRVRHYYLRRERH